MDAPHSPARRALTLALVVGVLCSSACRDPQPSSAPAPRRADTIALEDEDGDLIRDHDEGDGQHDSDGDGIPDSRDLDSDGDGISDRDEAGDDDLRTPPRDSDGDRVPDWRDLDSDGDGLSDADERGPLGAAPRDSDGDGTPDWRDLDSDDDGLSDADESRDGTDPRRRDTDGDGAADLVERFAGVDPLDPTSVPPEGGDMIFVIPSSGGPMPVRGGVRLRTNVQFLDLYFGFDASFSMNEEYRAMRHPTRGLASIVDALTCHVDAAETACVKHSDCPGGFVCGPAARCVQDPMKGACVPDIWTGVGTFGNIDTFRNLLSLQPDPSLTARSIPERGQLSRADGRTGALVGPWAEAPFQPPVCVVDGERCGNPDVNCSLRGLGCPGFRVDAVRVYIQISDADDQCADPYDVATGSMGKRHFPTTFFGMGRCALFSALEAGEALAAFRVRFIGLYGTPRCDFNDDTCDDFPQQTYNAWAREHAPDRPQLAVQTPKSVAESIAIAAHSVDDEGRPFAFEALDDAVVERTIDAVRQILQRSPLRVQAFVSDLEHGESVNAAALVDHIAVNTQDPGCATAMTTDTNGDAFDDAFPRLNPGASACWDILPVSRNMLIEPGDTLQVYRARLTVYGDGSPLDRRDLVF